MDEPALPQSPTICHLCGKPIADGEMGREHIPPRRYFPEELRKLLKPTNLIPRQPAHKTCNHSYMKDEGYFYWALGSQTLNDPDSVCAPIIFENIKKKVQNKEDDWEMINEILNSFSPIWIPGGKKAFKIDGDRIDRIAWKIIRGLFYYQTKGRYLPDNKAPKHIIMKHKMSNMGDSFGLLTDDHKKFFGLGAPRKDEHPQLFWYQLDQVETSWIAKFYMWDYWAFGCVFHDPDCKCEECSAIN